MYNLKEDSRCRVAIVPGVMASITQPTTTILTMIVQEQNAGGPNGPRWARIAAHERRDPADNGGAEAESAHPTSPDAYRAFAACIGPNSWTFSGRSLR
jgi:hypothetical protein